MKTLNQLFKMKFLMVLGCILGLHFATFAQALEDEPSTITWLLDQGGESQTASYSGSTSDYYYAEDYDLGNNLNYNGTEEWRDETSTGTGLILSRYAVATSKSASPGSVDKVSFNLRPIPSLEFIPTSISFDCARFGTDGGRIVVKWKSGDGSTTTLVDEANYIYPNRSTKVPLHTHVDLTSLGISSTSAGDCSLEFYIYNLDPTKSVGLANVTIAGELSGDIISVAEYDLAVSASTGGSVEQDPAGGIHPEDTEITLSATADFGYDFSHWAQTSGGAQVSTENPYIFNITGNTDLTAVFSEVPTYTVAATASPLDGGSIELSPADGVYEGGTAVTLTALPAGGLGYEFTQWEDTNNPGVAVSIDNPYVFDVSSNMDLTAVFTETNTFTLTWELTTDDVVDASSGTGWTAENQTAGSGVTQRSYDYSTAGVTVQRMRANDGVTDIPQAYDETMYVEYTVTAESGYQLTVTDLSMSLGAKSTGGMKAKVEYSTDGFATSTVLEETDYLPSDNGFVTVSHSGLDIETATGGSLKVRVFPKMDSPGTGKYLASYNVMISFVAGTSISWTGATDSDWATASNWTDGVVPTSSDNVSIPVTSNDPVITSDVGVFDIEIASGASVTVESGYALAIFGTATGSGTMTVKRKHDGNGGYSIVGSPVVGAQVADLAADIVYSYDESDGSWNTPSGTMEPGVGYFVAYEASSPEMVLSGTAVSGVIEVPVANAGDGYNLVANPYAAAISVLDFHNNAANSSLTDGSVYIWDDGGQNVGGDRGGDYHTVNSLGVVGTNALSNGVSGSEGTTGVNTGNITSKQGFFVKAVGSGSIEFTPDMQTTDVEANKDDHHYRKDSDHKQLIKLSIDGNDLYNETLIGFTANATIGKDYSLDAEKLSGNDYISFYSFMEETKMAIQGLPIDQDVMVNLGMDLQEAGTYTLSIQELSGFDAPLYLEDQITGKIYEVTEDLSISFESGSVSNDRRFALVSSPSRVLSASDVSDGLKVFGTQSNLSILFDFQGQEEVAIYSIGGRVLFDDTVNFINGRADINTNLSKNQVYLLKLADRSIKFIIQ